MEWVSSFINGVNVRPMFRKVYRFACNAKEFLVLFGQGSYHYTTRNGAMYSFKSQARVESFLRKHYETLDSNTGFFDLHLNRAEKAGE
jgi:hypothetical protein